MIPYIIMLISLILDGVLSNIIPFMRDNLSLFYPMFTLIAVVIIYPFYRKDMKKYLITVLVLGIIYDFLYTNLFIFNGAIFVVIAYLNSIIEKNIPSNFLTIILYAFINIALYEFINSMIFIAFNLVPISFGDILYKISHSLILNFIYIEFIYLVLKLIPKKYTKLKIN